MPILRRLFAILVVTALVPIAVSAQQGATISGRVLGDLGQPLGTASVYLPSLSVGTLTRPDGSYSVIIPAGRFQPGETVAV